MVYAADILNECIAKTKELFFPIRKAYWIKMTIANLLAGNSNYMNFNSFSNISSPNTTKTSYNLSFNQAISQINTEALNFVSKYGNLVGIFFLVIYIFILFLQYISSMFTFVFLDGIVKKELKIKNAIKETEKQKNSLFLFRFYFGLINLLITLLILSPVIYYFFTNNLSNFNLALLIPILMLFIIFFIFVNIILFIVDDFLVPIMYLKKYTINDAFNYFKKIAQNNKLEIFMYWLIKIGLSIAVAFIYIFIFISILLFSILLAIIGYFAYQILLRFHIRISDTILILLILFLLLFLFFIFAIITTPLATFFKIYSIEMVKKLESLNMIREQK
ncbi:MAG: hypothetical protein QXE31_05640 [Candidatus Woesearchaeota archaeon]